MCKFTPGPWSVWDHGRIIITDDKQARWLAMVENGAPETEANAHLIAAAPELYRALEQIIDEPNNSMSDRKCLVEIVRIARAALAKARGEA